MRMPFIGCIRKGTNHELVPPTVNRWNTKRLWSFILAIVMAVATFAVTPIVASAEEIVASGECGANGNNVIWALDGEGTLTVSGTGEMRGYQFFFYFGSGSPWSESSYIKAIVIDDGVTSIGMGAFSYCTALTSIEIPNSLTSIGQFAFYDCSNLKDVYYSGTKEEWEKISISPSNEPIKNATIHFNSTGSDDEPIVYLDTLMGTDPTVYNNELAIIAANLSLKTYDNDCANDESVRGYLKYDLGFDEAHHAKFFSNNYGGGSLAYTVATRDYSGSGADKLLVIACQGSTNLYELIKDATAGVKSTYKGYQVYDIVHDFYTDIVETGLPNVMEPDKKYKVLLTGHSLGGAAANLTGAVITDAGAIMTDAGAIIPYVAANKDDIFCYTFGSVNCIRSDYRIETGYENIHNVYNWLDTFSPKQYGGWLATGMGNGKGKFGRLEAFSREYRNALTVFLVTDPIKQIISHVNHDMDKYLDAIEKGYVSGPVTVDGETDLIDTYAIIACPVDIEIANNGQVVAQVVGSDVETTVSSINIWVQDDVKHIMLPSNEQFDITILSTGDGLMEYFVERFHDNQVTYSIFTAVQLVDGKTMTSAIGGDIETEDVKLYVVDESNTPIAEVQTDGMETPVEYTITVTDGTATPSRAKAGDTVTVTADTQSGYTFKEWSITDGTAPLEDKTEATTTFIMPAENVAIKATYTKDAVPTPNPTPGSVDDAQTDDAVTPANTNDNTVVEVKQNSILMPLIVGIGSIALICLVVFLIWRRKKHNTYRH